jgi:hypothetical protein
MKVSASNATDAAVERQAAAALVATCPHLYKEFERLTFTKINEGRRHYGARDVIGYMRWHTPIGSKDAGHYKVNNNLAKWFAIHFAACHPAHSKFYRRRISGSCE